MFKTQESPAQKADTIQKPLSSCKINWKETCKLKGYKMSSAGK